MHQAKICVRCRREYQLSAACCYHCGAPFCDEDLDAIRDSLVRKVRMRVIYCWVFAALVFCGLPFIGPPEPWYNRLLGVLLAQLMIAAWFGLLLYAQAKAGSRTPEGEAFRGPMPPGRAAFWTCFAAGGVFSIEYWTGPHHFWLALAGGLFCSAGIAGFAFLLNRARGEQGKAWARKYRRQILAVYGFALAASIMLKLWDIFVHISQKR